jgi:AraC-like DNA-binding protein
MELAQQFAACIVRIFSREGVGRVERALEAGHAGMPRDASLLQQPRLIVCLDGGVGFERQHGESRDVVQLAAGDGLFVAPGRWVRARVRRAYTSLGVVFYEHSTRFYLMRGAASQQWRPAGPAETWVVPEGIDADARALCRMLARPAPAVAGERFVHHAFECLLLAARELLEAPRGADAGGKANFTWHSACEYIAHNLQRPLGRKDVAQHLGVHPNHLSRLFAAFGEESFSAYLQSRRLERARLLLEDPRLNISEVARLSGFSSANYFIRVFRQRLGRTPTRARRA